MPVIIGYKIRWKNRILHRTYYVYYYSLCDGIETCGVDIGLWATYRGYLMLFETHHIMESFKKQTNWVCQCLSLVHGFKVSNYRRKTVDSRVLWHKISLSLLTHHNSSNIRNRSVFLITTKCTLQSDKNQMLKILFVCAKVVYELRSVKGMFVCV